MIGTSSGLPAAWVVKCKKCGCTINYRAIDPHLEHSEPARSDPLPHEHVIVTCSCCWSAFRYNSTEVFKAQPSPSNTCSERRKMEGTQNAKENQTKETKLNAAVLLAASFICRDSTELGRDQAVSISDRKDRRQYSVGRNDPSEAATVTERLSSPSDAR